MTLHFKLVAIVEKTIAIWVCSNQNIINSRKMIFNKYQDTQVHCANIFNPRRACAARVTVVVLRESWGAFFSMKGGKGEKEGGKGRGSKCKLRREIQIHK